MDRLDELIDLFNRTLLEAEANNAEYNDFIERCRIEDRKYFDEVRETLAKIRKDLNIIKTNLETL